MTPQLPTRIDRYEIVNRLGRGGMGEVYLATDPALGRTVAIKMLTEDNEELRERFAREARSAAALKHNNIVTIYDVGEDNGRPFIAMEYLDGETMAEMIKRRAPVPTPRKLELMIELCAGLGYAHRSGIVHRDIKPANLMITADGTLKILDFGIARVKEDATTSGLTRVGMVIGSTHYMSPEQAEGFQVDERSDIFSVGSVFYELLTGERAFAGDNAQVVLNKILNREPRPIRELRPDIDPELERIVNKGLTKDLAARYQTLAAMATDVGRVRDRHKYSDAGTVRTERGPVPQGDGEAQTQTPTPAFRGALDSKEIARRRAAQIELHLDEASGHFKAGRYEQAIEMGEKALVINPEEARALQILQLTHRAMEARQIRQLLEEADALKADGSLTGAERLIAQSLQLQPDSLDAQASLLDLRERRRERERVAERARAVRAAVATGQGSFDAGAFEAAARSAKEALAFDSEDREAKLLLQQAIEAIEARNRREAHDRRASEVIAVAKQQADSENTNGAIALLRSFSPPHEKVTQALADVERAAAARAARREAERLSREAWERRADELIADARARFRRGDHEAALAMLAAFDPPHPRVGEAHDALGREHEESLAAERELGRRNQGDQAQPDRSGPGPSEHRVDVAGLTDLPVDEQEATRLRERPPLESEATAVLWREPRVTPEAPPSSVAGGVPAANLDRARSHRRAVVIAAAALLLAAIAGTAYVEFSGRVDPPGIPIEVRVKNVVESAEALWAQGKQQEAIDQLQSFQPAHAAVTAALERLRKNKGSGGDGPNVDPREAQTAELIRQSQSALAAGRLDEALSRATQAATLSPQAPEATAAVGAVIDAAANRAVAARESAAKAGASSEPTFRAAQAAESAGRQARSTNPSTALKKYLAAEAEYRQAEQDYPARQKSLEDARLAQWVKDTKARASEFSKQSRSTEALEALGLIKERAPQTPDIDKLIEEETRRRDARESGRRATVTVPDLFGATEQRARDLLATAGLKVGQVSRAEANASPGTVLKQDYGAGAQVMAGTAVGFVLAVPVTAPPVKDPVIPPIKPTSTPANETAAVDEVVRGYGDAYRNMKVDVMKRLWPGMPANIEQTYRKDFGGHTKQDWQFESAPTVKIAGTSAEATGTVRLVDWMERIGRHETKWSYVIALQKKTGGWEISDVRLTLLR